MNTEAQTAKPTRDYTRLSTVEPASTVEATMREVNNLLWNTFAKREPGDRGVSWLGFYFGPGHTFEDPSGLTLTPTEHQMLLGPRRDKPACSPIALHGACGLAYTRRASLVITHVNNLGENYVACDPRDTSELVVPLFNQRGFPYAVFDADSFDENAFTAHDAAEIERFLAAAGLTHPPGPTPVEII